MSLYNALFGTNEISDILKKILNIDQPQANPPQYPSEWEPYEGGITEAGRKYINECIEKKYYTSGRFRDIYLNEDSSKIILYTRNGGGNRESYPHIFEVLATHPNYITNYDDDFDFTYAYFEFSIPEEYKEALKGIEGEKHSPSEKFQNMLSDLQTGKQTPETERAMNVGKKIFGQIEEQQGIIIINTEDGDKPNPLPPNPIH